MKKTVLLSLAFGMLFLSSANGVDGAALFQARCAGCHGASGEGKRNAGSPLKGIDVKLGRLAQTVTKGGGPGPHAKPLPNISEAQANAIVAYLKAPAAATGLSGKEVK